MEKIKKRKPMSESQKQAIRNANSKPKSEEHKKKIAEALKGKKRTAEQCSNLSKGKKGHKVSEEQKAKTRKTMLETLKAKKDALREAMILKMTSTGEYRK